MRGGPAVDLCRPGPPGDDPRRAPDGAEPQYDAGPIMFRGGLALDPSHNRVSTAARYVCIRRMEMDVLLLLARGGVVSTETIAEAIWPYSKDPKGVLGVYICNLRRKLKHVGYRIDCITKRGYELVKDQ